MRVILCDLESFAEISETQMLCVRLGWVEVAMCLRRVTFVLQCFHMVILFGPGWKKTSAALGYDAVFSGQDIEPLT